MIAHFCRCCSKPTSSLFLLNRNSFLLNRTGNLLFSVAVKISSTSESKATKLRSKSSKTSAQYEKSAVWKHLSQWLSEEELDAIPKPQFRFQPQAPRTGYLIDQDIASRTRNIFDKQNFDIEGTVIEINPGLGLLTQQLVELGFKNIVCFEEHLALASRLRAKFPSISVIDKKFLHLARLNKLDTHDQSSLVESFLDEIPSLKNGKQVYILGVTPAEDVLNFTRGSLVTSQIFYNKEACAVHPIYYYFLGPKPYASISSTPKDGFQKYRSASILSQLLFKSELLGEFSGGGCFPWHMDQSKKTKKVQRVDSHKIYLAKIETNQELWKKVRQEELYSLVFFVKCNSTGASNVIPRLEKFIPDCGPRLIRKGFSIYTRFGELSTEEILDLYLELKSWPDFKRSAFAAAVESHQNHLE